MHSLLSTIALYRSTMLPHGNDLAIYSEEKMMAVQVINDRLYHSSVEISDAPLTAVATLAATKVCSCLLAFRISHQIKQMGANHAFSSFVDIQKKRPFTVVVSKT